MDPSVVDGAVEDANNESRIADGKTPIPEAEKDAVKIAAKEYDEARSFDKPARKAFARDRRYASGEAGKRWAVNTNLIGSFIDILVSTLYARDPDVSVRRAPRVKDDVVPPPAPGMPPPPPDTTNEDFARTMELVISRLWKDGHLKRMVRKQVRSTLSVGQGWLKVTLISEANPRAETQKAINDAVSTMAALKAVESELAPNADPLPSPEEKNAKVAEQQQLIDTLQKKLELQVKRFLAIDFVPAQDMQISLDVAALEDHVDADWNANAIYIPQSSLKKRFPILEDEDIKQAKKYYQRKPKQSTESNEGLNIVAENDGVTDESVDQYTTDMGGSGNNDGVPFAKVIERWNRTTQHVETIVDGIKRWAKSPFTPPYASSRFYPYFYLSFYEVDGQRHPDSFPQRAWKLQDEYACTRSNYRQARERSIGAVLFNKTGLGVEGAKALTEAKSQEYVGLAPTNPETPLQNLFAQKPVAPIDQRVFDVTLILQDLERVSGVQEAQAQATSVEKTATEATIQQQGFASRTGTDRDMIETMLTEMARYTAEQAIQCLSTQDAMRIGGSGAFWPANMDIEDILTMLQIEISAGTTGKPKSQGDRAAWGVILPLMKEAIGQIRQAQAQGDVGLVKAITALVEETMRRFGDESDLERFIPQGAPPPSPPPLPDAPKVSVSLRGELPPKAVMPVLAMADDAANPQLQQQPPPGPDLSGGPSPELPPGIAAPPEVSQPGV